MHLYYDHSLVYMVCFSFINMDIQLVSNPYKCVFVILYAKQKHLGCKKVRGQSEATLQTGRRDQKV